MKKLNLYHDLLNIDTYEIEPVYICTIESETKAENFECYEDYVEALITENNVDMDKWMKDNQASQWFIDFITVTEA